MIWYDVYWCLLHTHAQGFREVRHSSCARSCTRPMSTPEKPIPRTQLPYMDSLAVTKLLPLVWHWWVNGLFSLERWSCLFPVSHLVRWVPYIWPLMAIMCSLISSALGNKDSAKSDLYKQIKSTRRITQGPEYYWPSFLLLLLSSASSASSASSSSSSSSPSPSFNSFFHSYNVQTIQHINIS